MVPLDVNARRPRAGGESPPSGDNVGEATVGLHSTAALPTRPPPAGTVGVLSRHVFLLFCSERIPWSTAAALLSRCGGRHEAATSPPRRPLPVPVWTFCDDFDMTCGLRGSAIKNL